MIQKESQPQRIRPTQIIASFLLKTYQILQHKQFQHIISWDLDNVGFIIKNVIEFSKQILPKYFRHSNFSSFVRQLNMYDFHKIKQANDCMAFRNSYFKKDGFNLLKQIKRKTSKRNESQRKNSFQQLKNMSLERKDRDYKNIGQYKKQVSTTIENELNSSEFFFQKSIKLLESQKEQINKSNMEIGKLQQLSFQNILIPKLTNSMSFHHLQSIYQLKKSCFNILQKFQKFNKSTDDFLKHKNIIFQKLSKQFIPKSNPIVLKPTKKIDGFQPYSQKFLKLDIDNNQEAKIITEKQVSQ